LIKQSAIPVLHNKTGEIFRFALPIDTFSYKHINCKESGLGSPFPIPGMYLDPQSGLISFKIDTPGLFTTTTQIQSKNETSNASDITYTINFDTAFSGFFKFENDEFDTMLNVNLFGKEWSNVNCNIQFINPGQSKMSAQLYSPFLSRFQPFLTNSIKQTGDTLYLKFDLLLNPEMNNYLPASFTWIVESQGLKGNTYSSTAFAVQPFQVTGLKEANLKNLSVYPNPFSDYLELPNNLIGCSFQVMDLSGRSLYKSLINGNKIELDFLVAGTYILKIESMNGQGNYVIVKQ
jgi:hypothetical protein